MKQENTRKALSLPFTRPPFFVVQIPLRSKGAEGFQRAIGKPFGRLRRGEILCGTGKYKEGPSLAFHKPPIFCCTNSLTQQVGRRFPKGERKALWSPPQRRNPLRNRKIQGRPFPCLSQDPHFLLYKFPYAARGPKVSKGRAESPLVASAEAKSSVKQKKESKAFSLPFTRNLLLVRGFARLRADEVLSHTGKYPKGAGGGQRVHVSWPPPDPPLLSYSAPLASQGRAQLGSRPSLGGPLSPSAQLIPPPAFGRRVIPGVIARNHCGRKTLLRYVPQLRCHAKCVPAPAPDWLLAQGQTK